MRRKDAVLAQADCRRIKKQRAAMGFLALLSPPPRSGERSEPFLFPIGFVGLAFHKDQQKGRGFEITLTSAL
jgi:hypothetical protein